MIFSMTGFAFADADLDNPPAEPTKPSVENYHDNDKIEIVIQSTMNGWQDFYEIKEPTKINSDWWDDRETESASDDLIQKALEIQRKRKEG